MRFVSRSAWEGSSRSYEHGELVPAQSGDGGAGPQGCLQAASDLAQQIVSGTVAADVIDDLEVVQAPHRQCQGRGAVIGSRQRVLDTILEERPVGSPICVSWNAWCISCFATARRSVTSRIVSPMPVTVGLSRRSVMSTSKDRYRPSACRTRQFETGGK